MHTDTHTASSLLVPLRLAEWLIVYCPSRCLSITLSLALSLSRSLSHSLTLLFHSFTGRECGGGDTTAELGPLKVWGPWTSSPHVLLSAFSPSWFFWGNEMNPAALGSHTPVRLCAKNWIGRFSESKCAVKLSWRGKAPQSRKNKR